MAITFSVPMLGDVSLLQLVSIGLALLILSVFIRQRYFSVVSGIPGPVLGTFGTCFQLWEIFRGQSNQKMLQLHREYGMNQSIKPSSPF